MFNLEQSIAEWRQQMLTAGIKTPVPLDELESHLREEIVQQIKADVSEQQAFNLAVQQIGEPGRLKKEFAGFGFLNWLGGDKQTRINRAFALFWLIFIFCGWPPFRFGYVLISGTVGWAVAGHFVATTTGFFMALFLEFIFARGVLAGIRVLRGKETEIRTLRFIAVLGLAMFVVHIVHFKTASTLGIVLIATVWHRFF